MLLIIVIISRKSVNFQMCLFLLTLSGVYLAERLNKFLGDNWKSFATQNYFDPHGLFLSTLWSGPLLVIVIVILVNMLLSLCHLIVRWKKAELRHRARLSRNKQDWLFYSVVVTEVIRGMMHQSLLILLYSSSTPNTWHVWLMIITYGEWILYHKPLCLSFSSCGVSYGRRFLYLDFIRFWIV